MAYDQLHPLSGKPLGEPYSEDYFLRHGRLGEQPYRRDQPVWRSFFGEIARRLVAGLHPKTVFDAGCAVGILVEAFRDLGVDAWGADVSDYAISQVRYDLQNFCRVASVTEELDRHYDVVTCIEVLEHVASTDADLAIANFARHSNTVLFSSSPRDYHEPTHVNVHPTDYWVGVFARHGFYHDLDFDASFISPQAMLFRRQPDLLIHSLRAYERRLWEATAEIRELRTNYLSAVEARSRLENEIEHHEVERGLLSGEAAHWEWRAAQVRDEPPDTLGPIDAQPPSPPRPGPKGAMRVLFVSDGSDGPRRYRCEHQAEALRLHGWSADVVDYADTSGFLSAYAPKYDAFVLQRLTLRPNLEAFIQVVRQQFKPVLYDIDDLIFDPAMASHWAPFGSMSHEDRFSTKHGMWRSRQAIRRCDGIIVPTEPLAGHAQGLVSHTYVVSNSVSEDMVSNADQVLAERQTWNQGDPIVLAYFSGTATHNADLGSIADAVRWALDSYSSTRLLLVGPVARPAQLDDFGDRIQHMDLQAWRELPSLLGRVSINLAPLESNNPFTECKSCIKYLEAALMEVPTVASPRHDFARVIRYGENGLLAEQPAEWQRALRDLIENPTLRQRLGASARENVLRHHTTSARGLELQRVVLDLAVAGAHVRS